MQSQSWKTPLSRLGVVLSLCLSATHCVPSAAPVVPPPAEREPVREVSLQGRVVSPGERRLFAGSGPRFPVLERRRLDEASLLPRSHDENAPLGFEVPPSPRTWHEVPLAKDGTFRTPPLASSPPPQLLAVDSQGRLALVEPGGKSLARGGVLDVGDLHPREARILEVELDVPETAIAADFMLGLEAARVSPIARDDVARVLSAIDLADPALANLLFQRGHLTLPRGKVTRLALPDFESVDLYVTGPIPGILVKRPNVALQPGLPTRLRLSGQELLGAAHGRRAPVRGQLVLEGAKTPVARARIVYNVLLEKHEAVTDAQGRFTLPPVPVDVPATVFVDAQDSTAPRSHLRTELKRGVQPPQGTGAPEELQLSLGSESGPPSAPQGFLEMCNTDPMDPGSQYPAVGVIQETLKGQQWVTVEDWNLVLVQQSPPLLAAAVEVPKSGSSTLVVAYSPFVYGTQIVSLTGGTPSKLYEVPPLSTAGFPNVYVQVFRKNSSAPATDIEVAFPSMLRDPDPVSLTTDKTSGVVKLTCVPEASIPVYIDSPDGCFDGDIKPAIYKGGPDGWATITLGDCGS